MWVGRNDPCPCGSGLKHKRCCLTKVRVPASAPAEVDAAASARAVEVRYVQGELEPRILAWAKRELGDDVILPAWEDFILGHTGIDPEGPEIQLFEPWLLYEWNPLPAGTPKRRSWRSRRWPHHRGAVPSP